MATWIGSNGVDSKVGSSQADVFIGLGGKDVFRGGSGNDTASGGTGDDSLYGDSGNDLLFGGTGNDNLDGGAGNDTLIGGFGNDKMYGGSGIDKFVFGKSLSVSVDGSDKFTGSLSDDSSASVNAGALGVDTIKDFNYQQDILEISKKLLSNDIKTAKQLLSNKSIVKQVGANVEINLGHGNKIVLEKVKLSDLQKDASGHIHLI